jgi:hypothetical protein
MEGSMKNFVKLTPEQLKKIQAAATYSGPVALYGVQPAPVTPKYGIRAGL